MPQRARFCRRCGSALATPATATPVAYPQMYRRHGRWRIWWLIFACVWIAGLLNRAEKHPATWFKAHESPPPAASPAPALPPGDYQWHPADNYHFNPPPDQH
jgi:hypothetical protein